MTRRERAERRMARRLEWAQSRDHKAQTAFDAVSRIADNIPLGQPILVGHHSEGRARRDAARIDSGMRKGCESLDMAKHHREKAAGISSQLARTIFSDDDNAIEQLGAKITKLAAERDQMKAANVAFKKGGREALVAISPRLADTWDRLQRDCPWEKVPFPSYALTNRGAEIRRCQKRLTELQARATAADALVDEDR